MLRLLISSMLLFISFATKAETVDVKYLGAVSLGDFSCSDIRESSDVTRICYDKAERYMLIRLKSTYYQYCEVDASTAKELLSARLKRDYFQSRIKGSGSDGPFDCRSKPVPKKYRAIP